MIAKLTLKTVVRTNQYLNIFNFSTLEKKKVVLFPGNGIGPEISQSVIDIFSALKVPI
jgi:hypothetical protein